MFSSLALRIKAEEENTAPLTAPAPLHQAPCQFTSHADSQSTSHSVLATPIKPDPEDSLSPLLNAPTGPRKWQRQKSDRWAGKTEIEDDHDPFVSLHHTRGRNKVGKARNQKSKTRKAANRDEKAFAKILPPTDVYSRAKPSRPTATADSVVEVLKGDFPGFIFPDFPVLTWNDMKALADVIEDRRSQNKWGKQIKKRVYNSLIALITFPLRGKTTDKLDHKPGDEQRDEFWFEVAKHFRIWLRPMGKVDLSGSTVQKLTTRFSVGRINFLKQKSEKGIAEDATTTAEFIRVENDYFEDEIAIDDAAVPGKLQRRLIEGVDEWNALVNEKSQGSEDPTRALLSSLALI